MKNKGFFSRILSNNLSLLIFSLLLSFIIWFVINANSQTESNVTISNIPITADLSADAVEDGLVVFGLEDVTASVEVTGNRITVGSLTASDIEIDALQANSIIAPGSYNLELTAKKIGVKTNYNFASNVTPSSVTVFVDKYKEKTFAISDGLVYKVEEGYYANSSFSESEVTVSGPETEVLAIDQVVVQGTMEGTKGSTKTEKFDLVYLDKDGNALSLALSDSDVESIDVSLTPIPILEVELSLDVVDAPEDKPNFSINPSRIKIAAEQSVLDSIEDNKVNIGTLDFSALDNTKHSLTYDISLPNGCKNLSDSTTAKVTIDLSDYDKKTLTINHFSSSNADLTKYNVVFNSSGLDIVVCGPEELIDIIKPSDVIATVDFSNKLVDADKDSVALELPISIKFTKSFSDCWVNGDYSVSVSVAKK